MTLVKKPLVVAASLLAIAACSSSGGKKNTGAGGNIPPPDDGISSDAPLTADEKLCDDHYKSQLDWVAKCGGILSGSTSAIVRYRKLCSRELVAPGAEGLRDARTKCIQKRATAACDDPLPECDLPPGTLANGAACADRAQCQSRYCKVDGSGCGTCSALVDAGGECLQPTDCAYGQNEVATCQYDENKPTGKCAKYKLVKIGEACGVDSFCSPGAHCESNQQNGPGKCVANVEKGGACVDATSCRPGLACIDKKCVDRPKEGEKCAATDDCADGFACGGTCEKPTYVNSGQSCDNVNRCERGLCIQTQGTDANGQPAPPSPPVCVSPIADGDQCGPNNYGLACDFFARCVDAKCVFPDPSQCK
jgi:hypothetical protein